MEQLDTTIGFRDGNTGVARELQRAASKATGAKAERNLLSAFRDIGNMCESIGLPKAIADIAKQLYKRTDEEKILRGKSTDAIVACCIFIACRQGNVPRSFREICQLTRVPKKIIGQCFKVIEHAFNLNPRPPANSVGGANGSAASSSAVAVDGLAPGQGASTGTSAEDLLARYCNYLDLHPTVQSVCRDVVLNAREHSIAQGRSPVSIAGGAILFTTLLLGKTKPVKDISQVAGVSESTIKLVYRLFYAAKEKLVKAEWIESGKADMSRLTPVDPPRSTVPSGTSTPIPPPTSTPLVPVSTTSSNPTTA
jgi:transcription initiation factor TFIIB